MSWQQTIIVGNVGRDPELRYLQSGTAVCDFSVAVSESWTDQQSGQKKEKTTWFKVSAWGKLAEVCNQYVQKGRQVMVVGTVEARAYLDKNNQPASSLDLRARDVRFLGGRQDGGQGGMGGGNQQYDFAPPPDNMNEIPF
ncbi:MAG: single-stranded DNA-binding protein [Anaerolineae bacterium]|nr:single-stranded DNA-binding protein [Anaerolineae bacterium]